MYGVTLRITILIKGFAHRGLKKLYFKGDVSQVKPDMLKRVQDILARLDVAILPEDLDLPGYRLHPLKGDLKGFWSITVSRNYRIIFRFENANAVNVDLIDYH